MKIIKKQYQPEENEYINDFTGVSFSEFDPCCTLKISFGYGSEFDGAKIQLDLTDEDVKPILEMIRGKLCHQTKGYLEQKLSETEDNYEAAMQTRDWGACDLVGNCMSLYRFLLDKKHE
jgi:hypothetical protein